MLIFLLIFLLMIFIIAFISYKKNSKQNYIDFKNEKQKAIKNLAKQKLLFQRSLQEDLKYLNQEKDKLTDTVYNLKAETEKIVQSNYRLDQEYNQKLLEKQNEFNKEIEVAASLLAERLENRKSDINKYYKQQIEILQKDYNNKTEQLKNEFEQRNLEIENQKKVIEQELREYEQKQKSIIDRFKKDEELKSQQDFYHISLDDTSKNDIAKLKNISEQLSKPIVLYKFIYDIYYKVKLEELFKRVLGENASLGGIYKITNINNQKVYIGRTTNFLTRFRTHAKRGLKAEEGTSNRLYQFMWEEGIENFTFEVVEICNKEEQPEKERYWIDFYKTKEWGYNSQNGG